MCLKERLQFVIKGLNLQSMHLIELRGHLNNFPLHHHFVGHPNGHWKDIICKIVPKILLKTDLYVLTPTRVRQERCIQFPLRGTWRGREGQKIY